MERETGFEPATSTLARLHSTTELLPQNEGVFITDSAFRQAFFAKKRKLFLPDPARQGVASGERMLYTAKALLFFNLLREDSPPCRAVFPCLGLVCCVCCCPPAAGSQPGLMSSSLMCRRPCASRRWKPPAYSRFRRLRRSAFRGGWLLPGKVCAHGRICVSRWSRALPTCGRNLRPVWP